MNGVAGVVEVVDVSAVVDEVEVVNVNAVVNLVEVMNEVMNEVDPAP